ncbi:MAG: aminotransferase class V-fold PLP-dependent enzyme [Gemmatimonadales bacterium]|nr:aminotransferase class V-fold PLP-dependent enzyme [Gemmatimonadales bacterium]
MTIDQAMLDRLRALQRAARPLEPGRARRRDLRNAVVSSTERFLRKIDGLRGYIETADKGSGLLASPISENGVEIEDAIDLVEQNVVRPGGQPAAAAHLAYIPGGGLYHSALGDFMAAVSNKYAGVFFAGPGAVRMENMLVRWVADLVGYPAGTAGSITSGGSLANLTAIATARDAHGLRGADYASATAYVTSQTHHSIHKALRLAGMAEAPIREVPADDRYRMRPDALAAAIAADRGRGLRPWLVVATAGTTDVGAVDPLDRIGEVARREGCWFHVDAAYGGFFLLTGHGRALMRGIETSDSVVLDPHKSLFLPYGIGVVLVRDADALARTHSYAGHYMQDTLAQGSELSPAEVSPELTKHFRAMRMWLPLIVLGTNPFAAALEEKLLLARYFHEKVQELGFEAGPEPDLSVVTFRWAPRELSLEQANAANEAIGESVRRDGRIFISSTMVDGKFTLRLAVLVFRTHRKTIDLALTVLGEHAAAVASRLPYGALAGRAPDSHPEARSSD